MKLAPGNLFNLFMLNALEGNNIENNFLIDVDVNLLWKKNWNEIRVVVKGPEKESDREATAETTKERETEELLGQMFS